MVNDTYKKIGERVKHYRTNRRLTQDDLAEGICSRQTISLLENGQHFPSPEFMKKIAEKLGVPFHEIMVDEAKELEAKVQLDIIKVYIETGNYTNALPLLEELEGRNDLLEYQRRELVLSKAECMIRTENADEAVKLLTDLQQRLERERENDDYMMATIYDKLGTANFMRSNLTNAYAHYMRAHQLTLRFPETDRTVARIVYNLGTACRHLNRPLEAIEHLTRAESFFKGVADTKRLAQVLFELGLAFRLRNELERADQHLQESLALYKAINMLHMVTHVKQNHAMIVLSKSDPDQALIVLHECVVEFEKNGDRVRVAYTFAFIAYILIREKRASEAGSYLKQALRLFSSEDAESEPKLVTVYHVYSMYLFEMKSFDECVELSVRSSVIFGRMGLVKDAADSLRIAAKTYREQGMFEKAYEMADQANEMLCRMQDEMSSQPGVW